MAWGHNLRQVQDVGIVHRGIRGRMVWYSPFAKASGGLKEPFFGAPKCNKTGDSRNKTRRAKVVVVAN